MRIISKLSLRLSVLNATYVFFLRNTKADFPLNITSKMAQNRSLSITDSVFERISLNW